MAGYRVEFYNARVRKDILGWPAGIAASFVAVTARMIGQGANLGMPWTRSMGDGLFEIRARGREGIGRAFFCVGPGKRIVVLHGIIKKSRQTPSADMAIARRRMKEVGNGPSST